VLDGTGADSRGMKDALTQERPTMPAPAVTAAGSLVRRWAFGAGVALLALVVVTAVAAPDLMSQAPLLFGWSAGAIAVVIAYVAARWVHRRATNHQSRRMRRWISGH
jgi:xanthine/uracil permease